jgi:hypothetical protein
MVDLTGFEKHLNESSGEELDKICHFQGVGVRKPAETDDVFKERIRSTVLIRQLSEAQER